jgi:hypothetical protein
VAVREFPFLLAAAILHLAVPVAAHVLPQPLRVRSLIGTHLPRTEIAVDVAVEPMHWPEPVNAPLGFALTDRRRIVLPPGSEQPPPDLQPGPSEPGPPEILPAPSDGQPSTNEYEQPPSSPDSWGIPGWPGGGSGWAMLPTEPEQPGGSLPAPTKADPRRPVDSDIAGKVIKDAMVTKDRTLGLDLPAAAAVAAVVADAVRSGDTPNECSATFSVKLEGNGKVSAVHLLGSVDGVGGAWRSVERAADAALRKRTFQMKSAFAKGAIITVSVKSAMRMPSGEGGLKGLGLSFDPTNIGAHPVRQVTSSSSVQAVP